jgi:hypothetical protein
MNTESKFHIYLTLEDFRRLLWFLIGLDIFLALMYLLIFVIAPNLPWGPIDNYFDLDNDMSVPSWFASLQYLFIGIPTFISAMRLGKGSLISRRFLYFIAAISVFLALDEAVGIHEQITVVAQKLDIQFLKSFSFGNHGTWISLYAVLGIILILLVYRDLLSIWISYRKEGLYIFVGGIILVMGEVGFEVISYLFLRNSASDLLYSLEVVVEEFFALAGVSLIFYGVMLFLMKIQQEDRSES